MVGRLEMGGQELRVHAKRKKQVRMHVTGGKQEGKDGRGQIKKVGGGQTRRQWADRMARGR